MKRIVEIIFSLPRFKRRFFVFVMAVILAQGVAIQVIPLVDREITALVERAINGETIGFDSFVPFLIIASVAFLIFKIFNRLSYSVSGILREDVWFHTFKVGFRKILLHDFEYITADRSGGLLSKLERAASRLSALFTESAAALFRSFTRVMVSLIIVFSVSWEIAVALLVLMVIYFIIYWLRFKADIPYGKKRDKFGDKEFPRVWEVVPQVKLTKLFTNEQKEVDNITWIGREIVKITRKRERLWTYANIAEYPFISVPTIMIKLWAAWMAIQGRFGIPSFMLLYTMVSAIQEPMWVINWFMWEMQETYNRAKKYLEIMSSTEQVNDPLVPELLKNPKGEIVFKGVSFGYKQGQKEVLDKIDFKFEANQVTALVGKSGAGKSTITNLICRLFDPEEGQITLGGQDIRLVAQQDLRKQIGFVMQDSYVFSGTVAENLLYANAKATEKQMIKALKQAQAFEFVSKFKKGLYTEIGERGIKLSGGQRQRLSIARVILKDPAILILDEATNALDSESEVLVQKALKNFMNERTVILVAHRLSTIQNADKIYVIDKGKVQESGSHEELIELKGVYKMLYDIQSGEYQKQQKILQEYEMV